MGRESGAETRRVWTSRSSLNTSAGHSSLAPPCRHLTHNTLSHPVTGCLQDLDRQLWALREAWALRRERCEESWHLQKLRQELDQAEAWLACREGLLLDPNCSTWEGPTSQAFRMETHQSSSSASISNSLCNFMKSLTLSGPPFPHL